LWWAFGYNLVGIPVAAGALLPAFGIALTPSVSGAVMAFSSVAVMCNSLLLQLEADRVARRNEVELEQAEPPKALSPANSSVEVVVAS
jgi:Cu2+-exporting ATPase